MFVINPWMIAVWIPYQRPPIACQHLRLAILCLLRARANAFAAHFALKCSSFCRMNVGTSRRAPCCSTGYEEYASVTASNRLLERTAVRINHSCKCFNHKDLSVSRSHQYVIYWTFPLDRTCVLILLATALGGVWTFEQPDGSVAEFYPVWRMMLRNIFHVAGPQAVPWIPLNPYKFQRGISFESLFWEGYGVFQGIQFGFMSNALYIILFWIQFHLAQNL